MFSLFLVTILTGVRVGRGQQGLESASAASFGFGAAGGYGSYGSDYGNGYYGSRYGYTPQFSNGYGGFSNVYVPGRSNPFIPFVRKSVSPVDSLQSGSFLTTSYRNPIIPQTPVYQQYQRYIDPAYPTFTPETQAPITKSMPYYSVPYFESVETYKFYNPYKAFIKNKKEGGLNLDSNIEMGANNKTTNGSIESATIEEPLREENTPKEEPVLQLTYLGYVPQSSFRSVSQSFTADEARQRIPFYILDYDDQSSGIPRSSSASPTMYVSPTRLLPISEVYSAPADSISHGIPSQRFSSPFPIRTGAMVSPYRSASSYRSTSSDNHPGYYLIDVNPAARQNARLFSEPMLGAPRPTIMPMIQTLTGPMGGPIGGLLGPTTKGLNTNAQSQAGFYKGGENVNKVENQNFKTGYETQLPNGHAYSNFQSNKGVSVQQYDRSGQQGFNNGYGPYSFGTPGLLG